MLGDVVHWMSKPQAQLGKKREPATRLTCELQDYGYICHEESFECTIVRVLVLGEVGSTMCTRYGKSFLCEHQYRQKKVARIMHRGNFQSLNS